MRILRAAAWLAAWICVLAATAAVTTAQSQPPTVYVATVQGVIAPATAHYIARAIRDAADAGAQAVVIRLDTPGGLLKSTEEITKGFLASPIPVIVYISPSGGRAASAGVFITYAAHVAAMAPTTHIGAATPVTVSPGGTGGGQQPDRTMMNKVTNDAVANVRGLAARRGRNAEWAEKAVRDAVSITEEEAVRLKVVDLTAPDLGELLRRIDGRTVETSRGRVALRTVGARVVEVSMNIREKLLDHLSDPNIGFVLMTIAIYGIIFELSNPGSIFPGVVGGIALLLALASFAILQVNAAGLALVGFAVILFVVDLFAPSHGVLTAGGVTAFILGSILLTDRHAPYLRISLQLIITMAALTAAFFVFAASAGLRAQRTVVRSGQETLLNAVGVARSDLAPDGSVHVQGELWSATAEGGPIREGDRVRVVGVEGLRLRVRREGP